MAFVASKVLWAFTQPSNLLLLVLVVGIALCWTRWRRWGQNIATLGVLFIVAIVVLPIGSWLNVGLETRFAVPQPLPQSIDGIIVLGGATNPGLSKRWDQPIINNNGERLTTFVTLARRFPSARLVFSGGSGSLRPGRLRQADIAKRLFKEIGFDANRVVFEGRSRNTFENATRTFDTVAPAENERWLLVTSAFHMPRAVGCFRRAGWNVIAYPTDYRTSGRIGFRIGLNTAQGLRSFDAAVHEWLGLIAYRLLGYTTAVFPAPSAN